VALERQLRPVPAGHQRVMVGGSVVIVNEKSKLIVDVFYDAVH
jgi:hypothetical protein